MHRHLAMRRSDHTSKLNRWGAAAEGLAGRDDASLSVREIRRVMCKIKIWLIILAICHIQ
jgi:hypothetical protein